MQLHFLAILCFLNLTLITLLLNNVLKYYMIFSAEPEDIVYPILFLLSDYSSMITGVTLPVDGGLGVCFV